MALYHAIYRSTLHVFRRTQEPVGNEQHHDGQEGPGGLRQANAQVHVRGAHDERTDAFYALRPSGVGSRNGGKNLRSHAAVRCGLGLLAALSFSAHAQSFFEIEAGIGGSAYTRGGDGWWVQDGFEHKVQLTAPSFKVGLTGDLYQAESWGVAWHVDWNWLGTIHTQSMATPSDANYNLRTKSCNGPCWPLANYMGAGHDQGFSLTLEPHYDIGEWRFGVAAGPYFHLANWSEDVTGWVSNQTASPVNLHLSQRPKWQTSYVVGVSVAYKHFRLDYQYFANGWQKDNPVPQIWKSTQMVTLNYVF